MIRFLDILIAITSILLIAPVLMLIFIIMLLLQGQPIFFLQTRVGRNFVPFKIYKLRTMKPLTEDEFGLTKGLHDERITRIGFFLRKYKLDELPQLINVIRGEMSIVGSRPQVPFYCQKFQYLYSQILIQKPGLLSPSAIKYSNEEEILDKVENPILYYEQTLIPIKCKMDIELVKNFGLKAYLGTIITYFKKTIF